MEGQYIPKFLEMNISKESIKEDKFEITGQAVVLGEKSRNGVVYEDIQVENKNFPLLNNHNSNDVIGNVTFEKTGNIINFSAKLNPKINNAMRIWENIKHGDISNVSIGVNPIEYDWAEDYSTMYVRKGELLELSIVPIPGFKNAKIKTIEKLGEAKKEEEMNLKEIPMSELNSLIESNEKSINKNKIELTKLKESLQNETDDVKAEQTSKEVEAKEEALNSVRVELDNMIAVRVERLSNLENLKEKTRKEVTMNDEKKEALKTEFVNARTTSIGLTEYLKSDESKNDFKRVIVEAAKEIKGDNGSINPKQLWENHLTAKGFSLSESFTGDIDALFPRTVMAEIQDCIESVGYLMPFIQVQTGITEWSYLFNKSDELGYGDNRADKINNTKVMQNNVLKEFRITTGYVYKRVVVPREQLDQPSNILYNYIIKELSERLVKTIERNIVIGDGLPNTDPKHDKHTIPMLNNPDTDFVVKYTMAEFNADILDDVDAELKGDGPTIIIAHKKTINQMRKERSTTGERIYERGEVTYGNKTYTTLDGVIFVEEDWMPAYVKDTAEEGLFFAMKLNAYLLVSYRSQAEMFTDFHLATNTNEFLTEARIGGNVHKCHGVVQIDYTPVVAP